MESKVKQKNFSIRSKELKINNVSNAPSLIRDYLCGKIIEITGNTNGHNYGDIGTRIRVENIPTIGGGSANNYSNLIISGHNTLLFTNFTVIEVMYEEDILKEIEEYKERIEELKERIKTSNIKIEYLKETKSEIFDETEFKAYSTLSLLENSKLSKIEKSKLIAQLINS